MRLPWGYVRPRFTVLLLLWLVFLLAPPDSPAQPTLVVRPAFEKTPPGRPLAPWNRVQVRPKVALVLSGGGARSIAQVGSLRVLEENGIPIHLITSTSLGAIVGGLYAAGYTPAELESIAVATNWDEVLSLTEEAQRRDLLIDKKTALDRSFLAVRFDGLEPVLPPAVSSGQRLTNYLSELTLQALYHPNPSFDDLRVRFRAVSTDLVSGRRVVMEEGSLAEALRASSTVPLLFSPIERDSMRLVDGGLVTNIPADIAATEGCDLILVVNSTSGLRNQDELGAPWQTADQIMGIMMQLSNEQQLEFADVVVTPEIGRKLASDFTGLDTLIDAGERALREKIGLIRERYDEASRALLGGADTVFPNVTVEVQGPLPDSLSGRLTGESGREGMSLQSIRERVGMLEDLGGYRDVRAEVRRDSNRTLVRYVVEENPSVAAVRLEGCALVPVGEVEGAFAALAGLPLNPREVAVATDAALRTYRKRGYSLARVDTVWFEEAEGTLVVRFNEGVLRDVRVEGGVRTHDEFLLRDFPLRPGDVFQIDRAKRGMANVNGTTLFEFVYLEVSEEERAPVLTIRVRERPSRLIRLGARADNERNLQAMLDIRDENFQGSGMELGINLMVGSRNRRVGLDYRATGFLGSGVTFSAEAFGGSMDTYVFGDSPQEPENRWKRVITGEYREIRFGGRVAFGSQFERLGNVTLEFIRQNDQIKNLEDAESLEDYTRLALMRFGTMIDSKDSYPFPAAGVGVNLQFEFAFAALGGEVSYNAVRFMYEFFSTWGKRHTFHPKVTLGFADRTMPLAEQFRLGGRESMFGTREDDRRGRQLLAFNIEYRYLLPIRLFFDTYLSARYDLATISEVPEQIKFTNFRHGIGAELGLDTPIGPAYFGVGKSFYFSKDLPENPVQEGPFLFTFRIGYDL